MAAFGHGKPTTITGDAAVEIARNGQPAAISDVSATSEPQFAVGDEVQVLPIDYGFQPTCGELMLASMDELIVKRTDPRAGDVAVHFQGWGFAWLSLRNAFSFCGTLRCYHFKTVCAAGLSR